jgi:hypothetical protein
MQTSQFVHSLKSVIVDDTDAVVGETQGGQICEIAE